AQAPPEPPKPAEPVPQKPDLRLPADVVRASKSGAKPLSEHLKKAEERRRTDEQQKKTPSRGSPAAAPAPTIGRGGPLTREARDRKKGGKPTDGEEFTGTLGGREARQLNRKRQAAEQAKRGVVSADDDETRVRRTSLKRVKRSGAAMIAPRKTK